MEEVEEEAEEEAGKGEERVRKNTAFYIRFFDPRCIWPLPPPPSP